MLISRRRARRDVDRLVAHPMPPLSSAPGCSCGISGAACRRQLRCSWSSLGRSSIACADALAAGLDPAHALRQAPRPWRARPDRRIRCSRNAVLDREQRRVAGRVAVAVRAPWSSIDSSFETFAGAEGCRAHCGAGRRWRRARPGLSISQAQSAGSPCRCSTSPANSERRMVAMRFPPEAFVPLGTQAGAQTGNRDTGAGALQALSRFP